MMRVDDVKFECQPQTQFALDSQDEVHEFILMQVWNSRLFKAIQDYSRLFFIGI